MKAKINDCRKCREQMRLESFYEGVAESIDSATACVLSMCIWVLEHEGKTEEEIKQFYEDFKFIMETSEAFGKRIKAEDAMKDYTEKYGFDFDNINVQFETKAQFIKRYNKSKEEN
jgi:hypothetical protein